MKNLRFSLACIVPSVVAAFLALAPSAYAAVPNTSGADGLGNFLLTIIYFIDRYAVPLVFALAFIVFIFGVYRYFIAGAANEEKRQEGQQFVMYGLIGFVIMLSVWGIINLLLGTLGFNRDTRPPLPIFEVPGSTPAATTNPFSDKGTANPAPSSGSTGGTGSTGTYTQIKCPPGQTFNLTSATDGQCEPNRPASTDCRSDGRCQSGYVCSYSGVDAGNCVPG